MFFNFKSLDHPISKNQKNLIAWLDASNDDSVERDGSNLVVSWGDSSSNGNGVTQPIGANKPVYTPNAMNGLPAIYFNGSKFMDFADDDMFDLPCTVFAVVKYDNTTASNYIYGRQSSGNNGGVLMSTKSGTNSKFKCEAIDAASPYPSAEGYKSTDNQLIVARFEEGSTIKINIDGSNTIESSDSISGFSNAVAYTARIGGRPDTAGERLQGYIAELIVFSSILSDDHRTSIQNYLMSKWGVLYTPIPLQVSQANSNNLVGWLDASNIDSITKDGSDLVSNVEDLSGNGNDFTQSTGGNKPTYTEDSINGLSTLTFDGSSSFMTGGPNIDYTVMPDATIISVFRQTGTSQVLRTIWSHDNGGWDRRLYTSVTGQDGKGSVSTGSSAVYFDGLDDPGVTKVCTVNMQNGVSSGSTVYVNGTLETTFTENHTNSGYSYMTIGSINTSPVQLLDGEICEILVFNSILSSDDRATIENYLIDKWGVS